MVRSIAERCRRRTHAAHMGDSSSFETRASRAPQDEAEMTKGNDHERTAPPPARTAALGRRPQQARPVAAVRQHARHAVLPRLRLGAVLGGRIQAPLRIAARQDARAQARRRRGAGRAEPLELRRRHDLAHRPLGVARAVLLRAGAARRRADHDLFDGRHARRSRAPPRRGRGQGRAPQPQRPVRRRSWSSACAS